jgi:predicted nucleic acid-binding protein
MTDPLNKRVYIDSNVFIYAVEGVTEIAAPAKELIAFLRERRDLMLTSEVSIAEVLAPASGSGAWPLHMKRRPYMDLLIWSGAVTLVPVTREILIDTAELRTVARLKLPDAIHLSSAIRHDCKYLVTGDDDFKSLPGTMEIVHADETGISNLLSALS